LVGYPTKLRSYDFKIDANSYAKNVQQARAFELKRQLLKVGTEVDPLEWQMSAPTVNAYYDAQRNHMVFPAGILQPPFYSINSTESVNLGAVGMVVGHELTHGFDDEGSQYDAQGNLKNWWQAATGDRFKEKTACLEQRYNGYEVLPGVKVNGKLTLGENIADLGGVKLAFQAHRALRQGAPKTSADGFSDDQQFFIAFAQTWCTKARPEYEKLQTEVDPHSPPRFRVNGPLANLPEFGEAFSCPLNAPMRPENACSIW
jgi:putative endopeptidase